MIETKLKQMGYSDVGISSLEWGNIIILIRNLKNALNTSSDLNNVFIAGISSSPTLDYQFLDEYLDSVLLLEDRASMANALESRVPLLDHRIIEFAATIPAHIKFKDGINKYLPKNVKKEQTEEFICKALEHYSKYLQKKRDRECR
jgi:hypothetical protein